MNYTRIPMSAIHPIIKGWVSKYMGTHEFFFIDAIMNNDTEEFEYLILPMREFYPFRLTLKVKEDGRYTFKTSPRPFERFSLTND